MIIVRIQGGLGNQLFQYAVGLAVAHKTNQKLYLDTSGMDKPIDGYVGRSFLLPYFNINAAEADTKILNVFINDNLLHKVFRKPKYHVRQLVFDEIPQKISQYNAKFIVKNNTYIFEPDIFNYGKASVYLDGYWQSFRYFSEIEHLLREHFKVNINLNDEQQEYLEIIQNHMSVALHIRRTDYINTDFGKKHFMPLPLSYYDNALKIIENKCSNLKLFVFSDDIEWCRQHFKSIHPTYFLSSENPVQDFYLMQQCKHTITANSSFSWWAAWLNNHKNKIVIAPARWYYNVDGDKMTDLLLPQWQKIPV